MGSPYVEEIAPLNLVSKFDISGFVDQPVQYSFDYPGNGKVSNHAALAFAVTIDIGEVWTDENGDRQEAWYGNSQLRITKGKLRPYELALLNEEGKSFASEFIEGGKFLTHLADNQVVGPYQEMKLWYLSRWNTAHAATLNCTIISDGYFAATITENFNLTASGLFEFTVCPGIYGFFGMTYDPHASIQLKPVKYIFWISDASGDISERRTFIVDNNYYEKAFIFYYVNPLSGVDCIRLTGEYTEGLKTKSETAYKPVPVGSGTKVAGMKTISSGDQRTYELNTGIKTRAEILALRDFLTAKERWMVDPDRLTYSRLIPVYIEGGDFELYNSMEDLQSLEITILEAHK